MLVMTSLIVIVVAFIQTQKSVIFFVCLLNYSVLPVGLLPWFVF